MVPLEDKVTIHNAGALWRALEFLGESAAEGSALVRGRRLVGLFVGGFVSLARFETDLHMRPVAKRLVVRVAAAAQRDLLTCWDPMSTRPHEFYFTDDQIRTVLAGSDVHHGCHVVSN